MSHPVIHSVIIIIITLHSGERVHTLFSEENHIWLTGPHFDPVKEMEGGGKQILTVYRHWKTVLNCTGGRVRCAMHADHRRQSVWECQIRAMYYEIFGMYYCKFRMYYEILEMYYQIS